MGIVIGVLVTAAVAILFALSIPVDLAVNVETSEANKIRVRLVWLFGLLNVNLSGRKPRRKRPARERKKAPGQRFAFRRVKRALLTKGVPTAVTRFLRRMLSAVKVLEFRLRVRFGFDDPADTGMLLAAAAPVLSVLRTWGANRLSVEADFDQEITCANGNMKVRIYPTRIVAASAMFLFSPAILRAAKAILWN